jgi:hypothetical protein
MRSALGTALLLVVATGCNGGADAEQSSSITKGELPRLVLQPRDVPRVFIQFDRGRQLMADQPIGARSNPVRFGRLEGWKARYRRRGAGETRGPLVIESRADLFESSEGATEELEAIDERGFRPLDDPRLGDEARAWSSFPGGAGTVRYYLVAWREDNVTALVLASGFEGKITLRDVLELARKQQRRMALAAD